MSSHERADARRIATPQQVNAVIGRVGELMASALTKAGHLEPGDEMPSSVTVPINEDALRNSATLNMWQTGHIMYSPAIGLELDEQDERQGLPASVIASFNSKISGFPGSTRNHALQLVPSFGGRPPVIETSDTTVPTELPRITQEDVAHAAARIPEDMKLVSHEIEAEEEMNRAMGFNPHELTHAEVKDIGKLAVVSIRPDVIRIDRF